jgi:hypothetical protein
MMWTAHSLILTKFFFPSQYNLTALHSHEGARGGVVAEALRYKPEGRGFIRDDVTGIFH